MTPADLRPDYIKEIKALGAVKYNLLLPETKIIPTIVRPDEKILGLVYGRYKDEAHKIISRGVLVATDERLILLNKKVMFQQTQDLSYRSVSAVSYSHVGIMGTVQLNTKMGDIRLRTFNHRCAKIFESAVERQIIRN